MLKNDKISVFPDNVARLMSSANHCADSGDMEQAVQLFKQARLLLIETCPRNELEERILNFHTRLDREEASFLNGISKRNNNSTDKIVVFADSLGLPSTEDKTKFDAAFDKTYSYHLTNLGKNPNSKFQVKPRCRRYATVETVYQNLKDNATVADCKDAHVLVHVGLNDTAVRMFLENQRLAITFLPEVLQKTLIEFTRKYRNSISLSDLDHTYVPIHRFKKTLHQIGSTLVAAKPRSVTLTTTIVPPTKFWLATPHINWNFSRYNYEIMSAAKEYEFILLDVDRIMWEGHTSTTLKTDGMHLSHKGCELFAERYLDSLKTHGKL